MVKVKSVSEVRTEMTTMVWSGKNNGYNKDTKKGIRTKIKKKETYVMTQNKIFQSSSVRHQEEKTELARNKKVMTVGRQKRLETEKSTDPYKMEKC
jgi:hypothetical protein